MSNLGEYESTCKHEWVAKNVRESTGKNLIGKEVTATVEDLYCDVCKGTSLKVLKFDSEYERT